jgi:signal transduction histidine kinase
VNRLSLWQRLSLLFTVLLLACFVAAAWLQMGQSMRHAQQIEQQLHRELAQELATLVRLDKGTGVADPAWTTRARQVLATHPGIELYQLDADGVIVARFPQARPLQRTRVSLEPVRAFMAMRSLPIPGDDPLDASVSKVFSVAPDGDLPGGYLYVVLQGTDYDRAAAMAGSATSTQILLWSVGLVTPLGLLAGLVAFRQVTRPLAQLQHDVLALDRTTRSHAGEEGDALDPLPAAVRDEIAILRRAFEHLAQANALQWRRLSQQDQQRREWIANISHDLRTPLASMQGYLETLLLQPTTLSDEMREQYLRTALAQSQRLSRLAEELLELARLELGTVRPHLECFSLVDLAQDVMQKLALAAAARQQRFLPAFEAGSLQVLADIGMIERVFTNLLDNAIRHTPAGSSIAVNLRLQGPHVRIEVADDGPGIPSDLQTSLFSRARHPLPGRDGGGLGLAIVHQILQLHGSEISLRDHAGAGAVFVFLLPSAD